MIKSAPNRREMLTWTFIVIMTVAVLFNITVYAAKADKTAPTVPQNLRAASITDISVVLEWTASSDNVGVKSYDVYVNNALAGNSTTTSYKVEGLKPKQSYRFYVRAKDAAGNISKPSSIITVTTTEAAASVGTTPIANTKVVGYYAAWAAYSGFTPDKVDISKLTHLNYAFANIGSDLKLTLGYPDIDIANIAKLNDLKKTHPNLKTLIAVGGWSWSGKFSDVALTEASRTAFADSAVAFIVKHGFDGIDIDWEYPVSGGMASNVNRPEDKQNFTLLMKKLREKLDARGSLDGKKYILSFAGAVGDGYLNKIEAASIHQYVDYINVMTYDIHGTWEKYTDFNAPLYSNTDTTQQSKLSVDSSIASWLKVVPAEKIIMGVPFYGYRYGSVNKANNGLYQTYSGGSSISYANIAANYLNTPGYVRYFHSESIVPWLFNGSTFISYEDEVSMKAKGQYIKNKGLGGVMIWELSQDPNRILLNSLYSGLKE